MFIYNKIKLIIKININELQIKEEIISILKNIYENIQEIKINNINEEILIFNSIKNDLINQDEFEVNKTDIEELIQSIINLKTHYINIIQSYLIKYIIKIHSIIKQLIIKYILHKNEIQYLLYK